MKTLETKVEKTELKKKIAVNPNYSLMKTVFYEFIGYFTLYNWGGI